MADTTQLDDQQLRDLIIETYNTLREYQSGSRAAKRAYDEAVTKKLAYSELIQAKAEVERAQDKLKSAIANDPDMAELAEDAKYQRDAVSSTKATLSRLLVKQATRSKNASVDVGGEYNREIILTAKLGQEAPEQLDLFDDGDGEVDDGR